MSASMGVVRVLKDLVIKVQFDDDMPALNEMLYAENATHTPLLVSSLERGDMAVCLNIGGDRLLKKGDKVKRSGHPLEIPVGDEMIGRVWDALGRPIDGKPQLDQAVLDKMLKTSDFRAGVPGDFPKRPARRDPGNRYQGARLLYPVREG